MMNVIYGAFLLIDFEKKEVLVCSYYTRRLRLTTDTLYTVRALYTDVKSIYPFLRRF